MNEVEDEQLEKEIELLFDAAWRYREYLKKQHREKLCGVLVARHGLATILFSESERYSNQICSLVYNKNTDAFDAIEENENENQH